MISSPEYHKDFNKIEHQKSTSSCALNTQSFHVILPFCPIQKSPPKSPKPCPVQTVSSAARVVLPVEVISFNTVLNALRHSWLQSILLLSEMEVQRRRKMRVWGEGMFMKRNACSIYLSIFIYTDIYSIYHMIRTYR